MGNECGAVHALWIDIQTAIGLCCDECGAIHATWIESQTATTVPACGAMSLVRPSGWSESHTAIGLWGDECGAIGQWCIVVFHLLSDGTLRL